VNNNDLVFKNYKTASLFRQYLQTCRKPAVYVDVIPKTTYLFDKLIAVITHHWRTMTHGTFPLGNSFFGSGGSTAVLDTICVIPRIQLTRLLPHAIVTVSGVAAGLERFH